VHDDVGIVSPDACRCQEVPAPPRKILLTAGAPMVKCRHRHLTEFWPMLDLATRATITRTDRPRPRVLLDTDFYKFLMLQFIWLHYRTVPSPFR